jgi:FdhD protein/molybdopterin-guanine dinucleotide biosynthesis protein A
MAPLSDITGVVLAGGQSTRFGRNKALVEWQGQFLIQHVINALTAVFDECFLVTSTADTAASYAFLNLPIVSDRHKNQGPRAGIDAALHQCRTPWIFAVACDMPTLSPELITFLCGLAGKGADAVIPWPASGPEPLCGLYHKNTRQEIAGQLQANKGRLKDLLEKLAVRKVIEEEMASLAGFARLFANVNRETDLGRLS